eukprot:scaffold32594_cov115-Phaeocystis_antarctica.AAC.2
MRLRVSFKTQVPGEDEAQVVRPNHLQMGSVFVVYRAVQLYAHGEKEKLQARREAEDAAAAQATIKAAAERRSAGYKPLITGLLGGNEARQIM